MASSPSPLPKTLAHLRASLPSYLSKTNAHVAHIDRLLSRTSTLDKTLLTVSYTLHLLHSILAKTPQISASRLTTSLTPLTAIFDDFRVFLRLWGLLGIYSWGVSTYITPPGDGIVRAITWGQVVACALYQGLENGAYLAGKGVLGWKKERTARAWMWSGRAWCAYVALELARLGYEWGELKGQDLGRRRRKSVDLRGIDDEGEAVEKGELELRMDKVEDEGLRERWGKWYREVGVNVAYAPMTVHYSLEDGILGEGAIGGLGAVVGALSIEQAWRETA
ncbi:MAG: hypothetical protein ASARMPREDX12_003752 [Alectoria sarmentosa]|nr:MAG: hypothetical protein ASARMPREDX12_003752 [Alectoria sarmentosa]